MPRKKLGNNPESVARQTIWNMQEDASIAGVQHWDIKTAQFAEAVLCILATGSALMIGTTQGGGAMSLTIFDGEARIRKYAGDSVDLDEWSEDVIGRARKYLDSRAKSV